MAANYPHQALPDETGDIWREGIERLALKYTLRRVRDVLADFLIRPGQRFFPHPSEIAEALEERMANERAEFLKAHPYTPCAECDGQGMVVKRREDGRFFADECECKKAWRRSCNAPSEATVERARAAGR